MQKKKKEKRVEFMEEIPTAATNQLSETVILYGEQQKLAVDS